MKTLARVIFAVISAYLFVGCALTASDSMMLHNEVPPSVAINHELNTVAGHLEDSVHLEPEEIKANIREGEQPQQSKDREASAASVSIGDLAEIFSMIEGGCLFFQVLYDTTENQIAGEGAPSVAELVMPENSHIRDFAYPEMGRTSSGSEEKGAATSVGVSPEFDAEKAILVRREAYRKNLKQASYSFNTPSPIKVATPATVFFVLNPLSEPMRLAEELRTKLLKLRPDETPQIESGHIGWSLKMRATLTGDNFDITPTEGKDFDGLKNPSSSYTTKWGWDIKAKHVGEYLPLHLRVMAVLPEDIGEPYEVVSLDKTIHVNVTLLWLLSEYWEKYWKWIIGCIGTALAGAISAWWKSRQPKVAVGG